MLFQKKKKKIVTALNGAISVGGMKSVIFSNLSLQTSPTCEHLCPQGHVWEEAQSCKHVELHLFTTIVRSWAGPHPLNHLRPQWELTLGMLSVACAYFISSSWLAGSHMCGINVPCPLHLTFLSTPRLCFLHSPASCMVTFGPSHLILASGMQMKMRQGLSLKNIPCDPLALSPSAMPTWRPRVPVAFLHA